MLKRFLALLLALLPGSFALIDRHILVSRYNPTRNVSSSTTPMQVGNGNFAFGADITGLQTFQPWAIMSSWGWNNDSLPEGKTTDDIANYHGQSWFNHGRLVEYDFGGSDSVIEKYLISNPNRVNLGRVGLAFYDSEGALQNVSESDLSPSLQILDLWSGILNSTFVWNGTSVSVQTSVSQDENVVGIKVLSDWLLTGRLGIFFDFPWNDGTSKFSAPFVGVWNRTSEHSTNLDVQEQQAQITHSLSSATFVTTIGGDPFSITRDSSIAHRYTALSIGNSSAFSLSVGYGRDTSVTLPSLEDVVGSSRNAWQNFWSQSGFIDVYTGSSDERADELQRRIILSRYLMKVNEAGDTPPQESGLVNNGWYGKFHMEMYFWHSAHWALWNNWDLLTRSSGIYAQFLPSSIRRAQVQQGWSVGARWPKMTDPSGRSAPGQINNLLLWQQPHPLVFAQYEYRAFPNQGTLQKWSDVVKATADWMAAFAWANESTGVYDLGPPLYVVSEDTQPNNTQNPAFELAYWRLGLGWAEQWFTDLGQEVPSSWTDVKGKLAKLPIINNTYAVYEGITPDFWTDVDYINDHPALVGLHGWLPPTDDLNVDTARTTAEKVWNHWNISNCWGWDFPMLAISAARNGNPSKAVDWLLDPLYQFDDVGMPVGGVRVPTPYFPGSGGLLYAVAFMAEGWDGSEGTAPGFPAEGWNVTAEGLARAF